MGPLLSFTHICTITRCNKVKLSVLSLQIKSTEASTKWNGNSRVTNHM